FPVDRPAPVRPPDRGADPVRPPGGGSGPAGRGAGGPAGGGPALPGEGPRRALPERRRAGAGAGRLRLRRRLGAPKSGWRVAAARGRGDEPGGINKGPKALVMLEGCGHLPVEEPGLGTLVRAAVAFLARLTSRAPTRPTPEADRSLAQRDERLCRAGCGRP